MKQILLSITLLIAVVTGAKAEVSGSWSDSSNRDETWGTDYESASTFTITNAKQLAQFAYMVNNGSNFSGKTVVLDDGEAEDWGYTYPIRFDGDLSDHYWLPIGTLDNQFKGTFNGNGKYVYGIIITGENNYQGLFGYIGAGGTVQNLEIQYNCDINGGENIGILAGYNGGTVTNCILNYSATVKGTTHVGGLIGNNGGTVTNCIATRPSISGTTQVGGLIGYNNGTVENCVVLEATINGTGTGYIGSIIGQNASTVSHCYSIASGSVKALGAENSTTGTDTDDAQCLFTIKGGDGISDLDFYYPGNSNNGSVVLSTGTATATTIGRSATIYENGLKYNNTHYYKTGATATITSNMDGWDVTFAVNGEDARISDNTTITVGSEDVTLSVESKTVAEWSGSGVSDDPYIIHTREQFNMLAARVNTGTGNFASKYYKLSSDIDYSGKYDYVPIGTEDKKFTGTFDGNGHIVSGLQTLTKDGEDNTVYPYDKEYTGLFGYVGEGGVVKNVKVDDPFMMGGNFTGGIVGYNLGTIDNCRINGERGVLYGEEQVQSTNERHSYGGIAGYNGGTIQNCVSAATVGSYTNVDWVRYKVGGIVGHNKGTVRNCLYLGYHLPDKEGNSYIGAIAGLNEGTLTGNLYRNNTYRDDGLSSYDNVGTPIKGVGASTGINGEDTEGAREAKRVFFKNDYSMSGIDASKLGVSGDYLETTNNPNSQSLLIYSNGLLFNDAYMAEYSNQQKGKIFYTTASSIGLNCVFDADGYEATFAIADYGEGTALNGTTLTLGTGDVTVKATQHRVPLANSWLAEGNRATTFSTTGENSITIMSAAELGLLAYNVNFGNENETYEGYTITIGVNEINLAGHTWEPIGYGENGGGSLSPVVPGGGNYSSASGFLGTFDGKGHIISNMNVTETTSGGLFNSVESGATVRNIIITGAQVKGDAYVGVVAGMCSGTIENCHVSYSNVEFDTNSRRPMGIGGIAGMCEGGSIKGCTVMGTNIYPAVADAMNIGGIAGGISSSYYSSSTATLQDCLFAGNIHKVEGNTYVGAIAGASQGDNTITNNYYVDGVNPYATPNTELLAINGADIPDGAERAYAYDQQPAGIGDVVTNYGYGMEAYTNVLHYSPYWYTPTAPVTMDITLSNSGDNSTLLSNYKGIEGKITLGGRTFNKNGLWNTICLPFTIDDINAKDVGNYIWPFGDDNVEVQQFTEASFDEEKGELSLTFQNCKGSDEKTPIIAGYPYIIRWKNTSGTIENPVFNNVTISVTAPIGDTDKGVTFIGTFASQTFTEENRSILFLGAGKNKQNEDVSMLFFPQPDTTDPNNPIYPTIGACRAYFQLDGITAGDLEAETTVRSFVMNFGEGDSDATRLNDNGKMINDKEADAWYTLDGRKVVQLKKGLYIHNHRIVNIK